MKSNNLLIPILLLFITIALAISQSSYRPYSNNQLKPHRWTSSTCVKNGIDPKACTLPIHAAGGEVAYFDVCLEHGELKRFK